MNTKKAVVIIGVVVAAVALLVVLFVAGVAGLVFYGIGSSAAAETAKSFLRENQILKREIGEVRDFGFFVTGNINTQGGAGNASLGLKAKGERKSVDATVEMVYRAGRDWRVVEAYYEDDSGERVYLTRNFEEGGEAGDIGAGAGGVSGGGEAARGVAPAGLAAFDEDAFAANVLQSERPVLVVVGSPSSLDSVELDRTLDLIAPKYEEMVGLVRYNLSEQPVVLQRLNVEAVPTVILYKGGEEQERRAGKLSRAELTGLINKYLE